MFSRLTNYILSLISPNQEELSRQNRNESQIDEDIKKINRELEYLFTTNRVLLKNHETKYFDDIAAERVIRRSPSDRSALLYLEKRKLILLGLFKFELKKREQDITVSASSSSSNSSITDPPRLISPAPTVPAITDAQLRENLRLLENRINELEEIKNGAIADEKIKEIKVVINKIENAENISDNNINLLRKLLLEAQQIKEIDPLLIHRHLVDLAKNHPLNKDDPIMLTPIDEDDKVVVSTGHQFDINSLIEFHNTRSYREIDRGLPERDKALINSITNSAFSDFVAKIIADFAKEKELVIKNFNLSVVNDNYTSNYHEQIEHELNNNAINNLSTSSNSNNYLSPEPFAVFRSENDNANYTESNYNYDYERFMAIVMTIRRDPNEARFLIPIAQEILERTREYIARLEQQGTDTANHHRVMPNIHDVTAQAIQDRVTQRERLRRMVQPNSSTLHPPIAQVNNNATSSFPSYSAYHFQQDVHEFWAISNTIRMDNSRLDELLPKAQLLKDRITAYAEERERVTDSSNPYRSSADLINQLFQSMQNLAGGRSPANDSNINDDEENNVRRNSNRR